MIKSILYLFILFGILGMASVLNAKMIYQLVSVKEKSDFDSQFFEKIDQIEVPYPKDGNFQIGTFKLKKGKYTIYEFIAPFISSFHDEPNREVIFHNILMIKVDKNQKIVDAWHYTMEWQDVPSIRLFRMQVQNLSLKRLLQIEEFEFVNPAGEEIPYDGILDDTYHSKRLFPEIKVETVVLNISAGLLSQKNDFIIYSPDSQVKSAVYSYYYFNQKEFLKKMGNPETIKDSRILVEITQIQSRKYEPEDPNSQSPEGGYTINEIYCRILKVMS
ncbi:MAG TPA: hypothetical protein DHW82_11510 [Spirochaetia bacterium]|nr:MAG: hypothetical protein A2Y41_01590 [Spirochaetes bacterium GWB1_36_13]HCL57619.1 hypothetical protein [Spirochaetia bacterium]